MQKAVHELAFKEEVERKHESVVKKKKRTKCSDVLGDGSASPLCRPRTESEPSGVVTAVHVEMNSHGSQEKPSLRKVVLFMKIPFQMFPEIEQCSETSLFIVKHFCKPPDIALALTLFFFL